MRLSSHFGSTLRELPSGAEAIGHQLLLRAGFIRQLGQGLFSYLPLGWRTLRKIEQILREEMEAIGGQELSMPVVHPGELWKASGRYDSIGAELVRFHDRRQRDLVLAMTHEEAAATLARSEIGSYRQLPQLVFQIQTKFRDDARPRGGLIRVREFLMKDSYSFDSDEAGLGRQYKAHHDAYLRIFERCGLPVTVVASDVGDMGGSGAHEFMYVAPVGEDTLVLCDGCGYSANRQVATFLKQHAAAEPQSPLQEVETPGASTIEQLASFLDVPKSRTAKALLLKAEERPIIAIVRGDMELNETKLANLLHAGPLEGLDQDRAEAAGIIPGYASPIGVRDVTVVVDEAVAASPNLVAGANRHGWHFLNTNYERDYSADVVGDIAAAADGAPCIVCGASLRTTRDVEVGNIFKLATRYSTALGATYVDQDGIERPVIMGSYGIGLGRVLACIAEEHRDDRGLVWPRSIAPYQVHLIALGGRAPEVRQQADDVYRRLLNNGIESLYDDRDESAGVKFADADLIGLPIRMTVSPRSIKAGGVAIKGRGEEHEATVSLEEALAAVVGHTDSSR